MKENILQTKFIEGTNQQYSIREDGFIISHKSNKILKSNKNGKVSVTLGARKHQKTFTITKLLKEYFNGVRCWHCDNLVTKIYAKVCNDCHIKDREKNSSKVYRLDNPEKYKEYDKKWNKKVIEELPKHYIANLLKLKVEDLSDEIYKHHRNLLLYKRDICKENNIPIQKLSNI